MDSSRFLFFRCGPQRRQDAAYQMLMRFSGAVYIRSFSVTPKASYHSAKLRGFMLARSLAGECTPLTSRSRMYSSFAFRRHTRPIHKVRLIAGRVKNQYTRCIFFRGLWIEDPNPSTHASRAPRTGTRGLCRPVRRTQKDRFRDFPNCQRHSSI